MAILALVRLVTAQSLAGVAVALIIQSRLGAAPWDVLHVGLARLSGVSIGTATGATSIAALLIALALGVRPGPGTLLNAVWVGVCVDAALLLLPSAATVGLGALYLGAGILLLGLATGLHISAELGNGPRDSLMLALAQRRSWTMTRARLTLELGALAAGILLGGRGGPGTLLYALAIGPITQWSICYFREEHA
jgi:uncharacterized membrane protein YczE